MHPSAQDSIRRSLAQANHPRLLSAADAVVKATPLSAVGRESWFVCNAKARMERRSRCHPSFCIAFQNHGDPPLALSLRVSLHLITTPAVLHRSRLSSRLLSCSEVETNRVPNEHQRESPAEWNRFCFWHLIQGSIPLRLPPIPRSVQLSVQTKRSKSVLWSRYSDPAPARQPGPP